MARTGERHDALLEHDAGTGVTATTTPRAVRDMRPVGIAVAIAIAVVAVLVGVRTGYDELDVDEAVYRDTLRSMRAGDGYYDAHRDALMAKEGAAPSNVRAVRPPTLFLVLRWFPESSWRFIVGIIYFAILLGAHRLGEPYGRYGGVAAVVLAGLWVLAAAPFLFLHAEVWGVPFLLWGAVSMRQGREARAIGLLVVATAVRELFGLALLIGLFVGDRRRLWLAGIAVIIALGLLHVVLADAIISPTGREAALGNERLTWTRALTILSPGEGAFSWMAGSLMLLLGLAGLWRARGDGAAALLLPFAIVMIPAALVATRTYWSLTWGPGLSAFATAGFAHLRIPTVDAGDEGFTS